MQNPKLAVDRVQNKRGIEGDAGKRDIPWAQ